MDAPRWLDEREERAWRGYMRMRPLLDLQVGRDLRELGLSEADYQVLVILSETPGGGIRLVDMASRMLWSKSRLAHHLDRMQQRGLVTRESHPDTTRAVVVVLTAHGRTSIEDAAPRHLESVRRHFIDVLSDEQLEVLAEATEAVVDHLRAPAASEERRG